MTKIIFSLLACLIYVQTSFAAVSPLVESGLEYLAVIKAFTDPGNSIPTGEFIIDIKRKTKAVNTTGIVKYFVVTRLPSSGKADHKCHSNPKKNRCRVYIVKLLVTPNSAIGPNTIFAQSIVTLSGKWCPK